MQVGGKGAKAVDDVRSETLVGVAKGFSERDILKSTCNQYLWLARASRSPGLTN